MSPDFEKYAYEQLKTAATQAECGDENATSHACLNIVLYSRSHQPWLRMLLEAAAIPHWFNHDILAALLPDTTITDEMYTGLISLPFVESFKGKGYNVHEATRKALRQRLAHTSPETMRLLSGYAAGYFSFYPDDLPERIYHQMVVDPSEAKVLAHEAKHIWLQTNKPELIHRLHHNVQELDGF